MASGCLAPSSCRCHCRGAATIPTRPPSRDEGLLASLLTLLPYFNERLEFRRDNVDRLLGPYALDWREFLPHLLAYAVDAGFMHRSERTVHEQILYRLGSKNRPITYHDIRGDRIVTRSGRRCGRMFWRRWQP